MLTADMVPDDPGIWLFHCHISEHMEGGMVARYQVSPYQKVCATRVFGLRDIRVPIALVRGRATPPG